jgi:hypothetical protein
MRTRMAVIRMTTECSSEPWMTSKLNEEERGEVGVEGRENNMGRTV